MNTDNTPAAAGEKKNVIFTVTANCQDCYRCVRACPVKAIRVSGGQAFVEDKLCIKCGTCVRECPQKAKTIRSALAKVRAFIADGYTVAASVAPSFAAVYSGWQASRLPSALRMLGFSYITETAEGADAAAQKSFDACTGGSVCTACPAVVNYIEMYRPQYLDSLIKAASPMVAHGRMLKKRYDNCKVVFIGPCAAKKAEAERAENKDAVDAVLTFGELNQWLEEEGFNLSELPESGFEVSGFKKEARLFPLQGGMLKTGGIDADASDKDVLHISGAGAVIEFFSEEAGEADFQLVEPLFCEGGCINGPVILKQNPLYERRRAVIDYYEKSEDGVLKKPEVNLDADFAAKERAAALENVTIDRINAVLTATGKIDPQFQLNCGACGYKSCLENAAAVAAGLAEPEMCMPYMRRLAHQRTDRIIETGLTGVVILDSGLNIIKMNPAFQKMFMCNNSILGKNISYLINADGYEKIQSGAVDKYESIQSKYGIRYHELVYALKDEQQYVGTYADITNLRFDERQVDVIKKQTLEHAKDILDHQIKFSQEMAHFLGKSTAKSEELVSRLISLYEEDK